MKTRVELKNELLYLFLIILVTISFSLTTHSPNRIYLLSGVLGILLILTWFTRAFVLYSGRKISQYSEVIHRVSLRERFFTYFVLPILFYSSLLLFIYFNTSFFMDIVLIIISTILLLILFLNVKSSFKKIYSLSSQTRAVFDFICIASFYMLSSVAIRIGTHIWFFFFLLFLFSSLFFWSDIKIHRKESTASLIMTLVSSAFVTLSSGVFLNTNIFIIPAISTLSFYLILSLWNVRFAGKLKLIDYLPPFIYSVLALIIILKL
ncbi:hypothetical protein GX888_00865 [Candidatus Dojkabacteria bacterium]|uniref:Uncharacterized protein n=1 Tax=Candidatus Dojkabacteria bacterium TaxID=2099670 RepID=A0A847VCM0_9BACT|nr:hypothetical protein [Candidatus Dojkabacteria bacterium]